MSIPSINVTRPKGRSKWHVQFRWNGRRYNRPIAKRRKPADEAAKVILSEIVKGTFDGTMPWDREPASEKRAQKTLGEVARQWLDTKAGKKLSTVEFYKHTLKAVVGHFGADTPIIELAPDNCEAFYSKLLVGHSRSSAKNALVVFKQLLKKAKRWGYIQNNPAEDIIADKPRGREDVLTKDEYWQIIRCCDDWAQPILRAITNTDCRRGDVLGDRFGRPPLNWDQVDLGNRVIVFSNTKEGGPRAVPINQQLYEILSLLPTRKTGGPVFLAPLHRGSFTMGPPKPGRVLNALKRGARRAGFTRCNVTVHLLRHTATTWMVQRGAGKLAGAVAGHRDEATTRRYTHLDVEDLRSSVAKIAG